MRMIMASILVAFGSLPAAAADKPGEDKVVCKRQAQDDTGSHLARPSKICMKASEWKLMREETGRTLQKVRDANGLDPNRPQPMGGGPG